MAAQEIRLWDLPTRLFHWLLVAGVVAAIVTGQIGGNLIEWHGRIGLALAGLVVFRLVWGVIGSTYARFAQFFPTPAKVGAYLRGAWRGEGHNPLGALSVFGLLAVLALQIATGLFANDDIAFSGPLAGLIEKTLSNRLTGLHHLLVNLLIALIVLHVGAILFYAHVRKQNLVRPMITGKKSGAQGPSATGGGFVALLAALVIALAAVYGASGAWRASPAPPAAAPTPAW